MGKCSGKCYALNTMEGLLTRLIPLRRPLFFLLCMAFMATLFLRNLPSSQLQRSLGGWYDRVTDPLGLYEHGWGMFPGTTTSTFTVKITRTFLDGTSTVEYPFPLHSHWIRSVW